MRFVRFVVFLGVVLTVSALTSEAQSRLNFPRVLSADELKTTGFAFVNTASFSVGANFNFYKTDGTMVGSSTLDVPAGGQVAKLASEILPTANSDVWIQVSSNNPELQGFEIIGNFATVVDGAGPAAEGTQLAVIDFSKEDIIYVVNPTSQTANVQIKLNAADGSTLTTKSVSLSGFQSASYRLGDLNNDDNIDAVLITSNVAVSASLVTKLPGGADVGLTNAVPTTSAPSSLFFPFAPAGQQGGSVWKTFLGITNVGTATQSVSITFNGEGGNPVTIQRNLAVGASIGDSAATLFSLPPSAFTAGWIRVSGSGPLVGAAAYQDSASGALAIVPSQASGSTRFFFGHIASLSPWYTGIALLNTTSTAANVEVYAIGGNGESLGALAAFTLSANSRRTSLLSEFVPKVLERASDGGWVFVRTTNSVPLLGFELFGSAIFPILANVQGFALPSTSSFIPPTVTTVGGVSIESVSFNDGMNPKSSFKPGDVIGLVGTIKNSSGATGSVPVTTTISDPAGNLMLTGTTNLQIPVSSTTISTVSGIPSNALNGRYVVTVSLVYQGQTAARSATFDVSGGTTTPSAGQETAVSLNLNGVQQFAFRPGDPVVFSIPMANFTGQSVASTLNYSLTGPGNSSAGSGALNFSMPPGISFQSVNNLSVPTSAQQGLLAFSSKLSAGSNSSTKTAYISVVPKTAAETITVENVFATDPAGTPRGGFAPSSDLVLNIYRLSTFPSSVPATLRYTVTGPNATAVLDRQFSINLRTGGTTDAIPMSLGASAALGNYTFDGTITYQDGGATKTSTMSTTFVVSATPPVTKEVLTAMRPYTSDVNLVTRTSFSPGEPVLFNIGVYSTFANPVSGTVRFQVFTSSGIPALDSPSNFTFLPGMTSGFVAISTSTAIAADTYTFTTTVTGGGASSTSSTTFAFAGPPVPTVSSSTQASIQADSGKAFFITEGQGKFPVTIHPFSVNDAEESLKQR